MNGDACVWSVSSGQRIAEDFTGGDEGARGRDQPRWQPRGHRVPTTAAPPCRQASTGKLITPLSDPGHQTVDWVAFSPNGARVAIGDANGNAYIWSIGPGGQSATRTATIADSASKGVWAVAFSPDSTTLAIADVNGNAYLWSVAIQRADANLHRPRGQVVTAVAFTPDGKTLLTGNHAGSTDRWQIARLVHRDLLGAGPGLGPLRQQGRHPGHR